MSRQDSPIAPSTFPFLEPPASGETPPGDPNGDTGSSALLLQPGVRIERYVVEAWIGEGGVASVYRVRHRTLETLHALKVLRFLRADLFDRLLAEGRLQARLIHPNIIRVQDVLEVRGAPALLMEYVQGDTLARRLREGMLPLVEVEAIFRDIVAAVAYAHEQGVVHRDLKPGNVLLVRRGPQLLPRVSDFGIARHLWLEEGEERWTHTGALLGTPDYMAPEQLRDTRRVSARADLFSLGVMLYELCCGRRPFSGPDLLSTLNALAKGHYPPPRAIRPELPEPLCSAIEACLAVAPESRVPDCATLIAILDGEPWSPGAGMGGPASAPDRPSSPLPEGDDIPEEGVAPQDWELPSDESPLPPMPRVDKAPESLTSPGRRSRGRRRELAAVALILFLILALAVQHGRERSRTDQHSRQLAVSSLTGEAWRLADSQPAEALALLLAAAAVAGEDGGSDEAPLSLEEVYRLDRLGAGSHVIPAGGQVLTLDLSPDGTRFAGGLLGGALAVWDRQTGLERLRTDSGVGNEMATVRFSPDGGLIVVVPQWGANGPDGPTPVRGFDPETGRLRYTFAHGESTTRFIFSPDGTRGVTAGRDSRILIWNLATGSPDRTLRLPEPAYNPCLAISPDNTLLAIGQPPGTLRLFQLGTGRELWNLRSPMQLEGCRMRFSAGGDLLTVGALGGVGTWQVDGRPAGYQPSSSSAIFDVAQTDDLVLAGDRRPHVTVWTVPSLEPAASLVAHASSLVHAKFSPDGRQVTTASSDGLVASWESLTGRPLRWHRGHRSRVLALEHSMRPGEDLLMTGSRDNTLRLWSWGDTNDGLAPVRRRSATKSSAFMTSDDGRWLAFHAADGTVRLLDLDRQQEKPLPDSTIGAPNAMAFSADGRSLAIRSPSAMRLYHLEGNPALVARPPLPVAARWLELSPDRRYVVAFGDASRLDLIEAGPGGKLRSIALPGAPYQLRFSADGTGLVVGTRAGHLVRVDLNAPDSPRTFRTGDSGVAALELLAGGRQALIGDWTGRLARWDLERGIEVAVLRGHRDAVVRVGVSPEGSVIASASWDHTVRLWTADTGEARAVLDHGASDPTALVFSPDGALLATGTRDGTVRLWDVSRGRLSALRRLQTGITALSFPRPGLLRMLDMDGLAYDWDLSTLRDEADPIRLAARLTNLRACPGTREVVPVVPFPSPDQLLAPPEACVRPSIPEDGARDGTRR